MFSALAWVGFLLFVLDLSDCLLWLVVVMVVALIVRVALCGF